MTTTFHAVMIDETGCEFGASVTAATRAEAFDKLRDNYPESRVDQLESPADSAAREARLYADLWDEGDDWDEDEDEDEASDWDEGGDYVGAVANENGWTA